MLPSITVKMMMATSCIMLMAVRFGDGRQGADVDPIWDKSKFADLNNDGNIDNDDKYYAGQRYPKIMLGVHAGFEYKGFDFYVQANANTGKYDLH